MKKLKYLLFTCCTVLLLSSCIKSEEPNSEADILACKILENGNNNENLILKSSPSIDNNSKGSFTINLYVKKDIKNLRMTPFFIITKGATVYYEISKGKYELYPEEGVALDFSESQNIKVISEDKHWEKIYKMSIITNEIPLYLPFENVISRFPSRTNTYYDFVELDKNREIIMNWASGNPGYSLTGSRKKPDDFPTTQDLRGYEGSCLKLTTLSTGTFGNQVNKPIAAGNLFTGQFETGEALNNPLKATKFGSPFSKIPLSIEGYYKYERGPEFSEKGVVNPERKDIGDIYAVFYETDKSFESLNGTNQFTDEHIVSIARIGVESTKMIETLSWTKFDIPFIKIPGKIIDKDKLNNGKYKLAIVFSSSKEGDLFNGAIGSTLWIDEVKINIQK